MIELAKPELGRVKVQVVGIGNAGGTIVKRVARERLAGVEVAAINTALKDLGNVAEIRQLQIGTELTRGHGAGMDPKVGRKAALEDANRIRDFIGSNELVFLVAGMGKGTGTGATPVVGELAREQGALVIAFVTTPFDHEKRCHHDIAEEGLKEIQGKVDVYVPLPNQRLYSLPSLVTYEQACAFMDEVILQAIRAIVDVLLRGGRMSLDLADLRTLFKGAGLAAFSTGYGKGEGRVAGVIRGLSEYPFAQGGQFERARNVLVSISGGPDLGLKEVDELSTAIGNLHAGEPQTATGIYQDESLQGELRAMVLAAGVVPAEEPQDEYELFAGREAAARTGATPYRPAGWAGRTGRPAPEREAAPVDEDNIEVPAYLRKPRNGVAKG
ncbi:MAG: cell division protein FtsZ [Candidatus Coatesbacteria bacterium]